MKRATIYFDEELHKALKIKAVESSSTVSDIVNDAVSASFAEDLEDLQAFDDRKNETPISYEAFLKQLKAPCIC